MNPTVKTIAWATLVAGTLDLLSAFLWSALQGGTPIKVLNAVASGPFGRQFSGVTGAGVGLIVHFALMAVMAAVIVIAMTRWALLRRRAWIIGLAYGLAIYGVMYWIVLPMRWPTLFPQTDPLEITKALVSHLLCVGLPLALIAARRLKTPE
jgi:hypothetical protein